MATGVDNIQEKMDYYQNAYDSAQVNDIKEYTEQTLGNIIDQMGIIVIGGMIITVHYCCIDYCLILTDVIIKGYVANCHYAKYRT